MKINLLFLFCLGLFISACVTKPTKNTAGQNNLKIQQLEQQLSANNVDPYIIAQLADTYQKAFAESGSEHSRDKAIDYYSQYLEHAPEHDGVMFTLYRLLLQKQLANTLEDPEIYQKLKALYQRSKLIRHGEIASPTLSKALWKTRHGHSEEDITKALSLLKDAIKEHPTQTMAYIISSDIQHIRGHKRLAIASLRQAVRMVPEDFSANKKLAERLLEKIRASGCVTHDQHLLDETIRSYKKVIKITPDDIESQENLSRLFLYRGRVQLSLYTAKLIHEKHNNDDSKWILADALADNRQWEKAETLYLELLKKPSPNNYVIANLAQLYTSTGRWQAALEYWEKYLNKEKDSTFYDHLAYSLVLGQLNGSQIRRSTLESDIAGKKLSPWEEALYQYQLGKLSEQTLLTKAKTECERTEAQFYIAYDHWLNRNLINAKVHFQEVIKLNVRAYLEYNAAISALKLLANAATLK